MEVFTLQKKQGRLVTFLGNFLHVPLHDYLLLPQSNYRLEKFNTTKNVLIKR